MNDSATGSRLDRMRRTTDDKVVAGVAGGLARELDIDPVIVRIGFVVLTFVGFAGPLLYVAGWLLIPAHGARRSVLGDLVGAESDSQLRTVGLVIAAGVAAAAVLGDTAWGPGAWFWGVLWATLWIAVPVAAIYWFFVVRPRSVEAPSTPPPPYRPSDAAAFAASSPTETATAEGDVAHDGPAARPDDDPTTLVDDGAPPPPPPAATPTATVPPAPRRRWSPALLLVTVSAILVAMGALGLWSVTREPLDPAVYPAVALGIVAIGLFVGTRYGDPGALVFLGLLITPILALASVAPNLSVGDIELHPRTAAEIAAPIEQGFGRVHVDLTTIENPDSLTGRTLEIDNGLGDTTVVVPEGLDVQVDATLTGGGRIEVFDRVSSGQSPFLTTAPDAPGAYRIEIDGMAGEVKVMRR